MGTQLLKGKAIETPLKNSKRYIELEKYRLARQWAKKHVVMNSSYSIPFSEIYKNYLNFIETTLKDEKDEVKTLKQFRSNELGFFLKNYAAEQLSNNLQDISFSTSRSIQGIIYHGLLIKDEV